MRKSSISLILGFIIFAAFVSSARAEMRGHMGGQGWDMPGGCVMGRAGGQEMGVMPGAGFGMNWGEEHHMWKSLEDLGLDDKQKDALRALHSKTMKDMIKKRADKQIAGLELRDLLAKDPVDMKAVEAAVKKIESLRTDMFLTHIKAFEEMKSILTPDQRKKFKDMMEERGPWCGMMRRGVDAPEPQDMPMQPAQ
jgi:Spy/CpxP family protein refolding chaperone